MELLEREHFFEQLAAVLSEVEAGNGRTVLVSGEAGIGKTALIERFAAQQKSTRVLKALVERGLEKSPLARLFHHPSQADDGAAVLAVDILEKLPPDSELAMAFSNRAQLHMLADETAQAEHWGQHAIVLAEKLGDDETLAHALNNIGSALMIAGDKNGQPQLERSLQLSLARGFQEHAARAYTNLASNSVKDRDCANAIRYLNDGSVYSLERDLDS